MKNEKQIPVEEQRQIQFEILKYVDGFCKANAIQYSLAFGTLIGAVRHKGFIPWDDDIDIMMTRDNYEKFRQIYKSPSYPLIDLKTDVNYPLSMGKIHDNRTYYYRSGVKRNFGLFIDIFPFDNVPEDVQERYEWVKVIQKLNRLNIAKNTPIKYSSFLGTIKKLVVKAFCSSSYIHKKMESLYVKYNSEGTKFVGVPAVMSMKAQFCERVFPRELFSDYTTLVFENHQFPAISRYDIFLKIFYGDYMQLPPVEQRVGKHDIKAYYK